MTVHASSSIHPITTDAPVTGWVDVRVDADGRLAAGAPVDGRVEVALGSMRAGNPLIDREAERRLHVRRYPTVVGRLTALSPAATPAPDDGDGDGDDPGGDGGPDDGSDHDGSENDGQSTKGGGDPGEDAGDGRGAAFAGEGTLDFHGVTRPLHGVLRLTEGADGALTLRGTAELDVTDFGVQPPSLLLVKVHPRIRVELSAVALAPEA